MLVTKFSIPEQKEEQHPFQIEEAQIEGVHSEFGVQTDD